MISYVTVILTLYFSYFNSELRIDYNAGITDQGILLLCASAAPLGKSKKLSVLKLDGTSISVRGLGIAIEHLPFLTLLKHHLIGSAVLHLATRSSAELKLKLEYLFILQSSFQHIQIKQLCQAMPCIKTLKLHGQPSLSPLLDLTKVTKLVFHDVNYSSLQLSSLIMNHSKLLTKLEILSFKSSIDVSLIGYYCLQLEELILICYISQKCEYVLSDRKHFCFLKKLQLSGPRISYVPENVFECCLSSEYLQSVTFHSMWITQDSFDSLIEKARAYEQVFSSLQVLYFSRCRGDLAAVFRKIICVAPQLKEIQW